MFKRLLVPADGSGFSQTSLDYAVFLAKKYTAQINVLYVIDSKVLAGNFLIDLGGMTGATPYFNLKKDISRVLKEKSKLILKIFSERCKKAGIKCMAATSQGIISQEIIKSSLLNDLIIMGQHGENVLLSHELLGSNTETVVRKTSKPLLITPEKMRPFTSVLLAYDGSQPAKNALKYTAELVKELGLKLNIITGSSSEQKGRKIVKEAAGYFKSYKITPKTFIVKESPAESILNKVKSTKSDLIIMGFHGHSLIRDLILGSTTEEVIRKTSIPVMLCH